MAGDVHRRTECPRMVCCRLDAPAKDLVRVVAHGDQVLLRRLSQGRDVVIFINDRVADEQHAVVLHGLDERKGAVNGAWHNNAPSAHSEEPSRNSTYQYRSPDHYSNSQ